MEREALLFPLVMALQVPEAIEYLGTDQQSCLEAFRRNPTTYLFIGDRLAAGDGVHLARQAKQISSDTRTFLICANGRVSREVMEAAWIDGMFLVEEVVAGKGVLLEAILAVLGGYRYRSAGLRSFVDPGEAFDLRDRDYQILACLAEGLSNREIAARLMISEETAKTYTKRFIGKLGARNRMEALLVAVRNGLTALG